MGSKGWGPRVPRFGGEITRTDVKKVKTLGAEVPCKFRALPLCLPLSFRSLPLSKEKQHSVHFCFVFRPSCSGGLECLVSVPFFVPSKRHLVSKMSLPSVSLPLSFRSVVFPDGRLRAHSRSLPEAFQRLVKSIPKTLQKLCGCFRTLLGSDRLI